MVGAQETLSVGMGEVGTLNVWSRCGACRREMGAGAGQGEFM